jgi:hypothetical protein
LSTDFVFSQTSSPRKVVSAPLIRHGSCLLGCGFRRRRSVVLFFGSHNPEKCLFVLVVIPWLFYGRLGMFGEPRSLGSFDDLAANSTVSFSLSSCHDDKIDSALLMFR